LRATLIVMVLAVALSASAQESRVLRAIERPAATPKLPGQAERLTAPLPISRDRVEAAVRDIARAWEERRLESVLSDKFYDRERLLDALQTIVPRDAKLRVTSIQGWQVVEQYRLGGAILSQVSVTVRTQVEFNDVRTGFQTRDGTNDLLLTFADPAR